MGYQSYKCNSKNMKFIYPFTPAIINKRFYTKALRVGDRTERNIKDIV